MNRVTLATTDADMVHVDVACIGLGLLRILVLGLVLKPDLVALFN